MKIFGVLKGIKSEVLSEFGFPIDGIQLRLKKDLNVESLDFKDSICKEFYSFNEFKEEFGDSLQEDTDIFLDISSSEYCYLKSLMPFRGICESIQIDGNETSLPVNSKLVGQLIRNSEVTEIIVSGDYIEYKDKLKLLGRITLQVGNLTIHKKCNKAKFY